MRFSTILCLLAGSVALAQNPAVTISVDAAANRHPINPNVYGVAYGTAATLSDLNAPLNRYGGNNTSRYNWQLNADNRGQRLVLREHRRPERHGRRARRHLHRQQQGRGRAGDAHHPDDRLGGQTRREPGEAGQLLASEVRRADRQ